MVAPGCAKRVPPSGSIRPAAIRSSVDLPEPLRPTRHRRSPCPTDSSAPSRTAVLPKVTWMFCSRISGAGMKDHLWTEHPPGRRQGCEWRGNLSRETNEQIRHVVGVFFLDLQDIFHQLSRRRVVIAEPADDLRVGFDCDALGDEVLADHRHQIAAFDI